MFQIAQWIISPESNRVESELNSYALSPLAMDVLLHLADNAGQVVAKDDLITKNWRSPISDNALHKVISEVRKTLDDADSPSLIKTIPKRGYVLNAEVTPHHSAEPNHLGRFSDDQSIITNCLSAAATAMNQRYYDLCSMHLKLALDRLKVVGDPTALCEVNLKLAEALILRKGIAAATPYNERARELALETGNHVLHARALLGLSGALQQIFDEKVLDRKNQLQLVLTLLPDSEPILANRVRTRILSFTRPITKRLQTDTLSVVQESRALDNPEALAHSLITCHESHAEPEHHAMRLNISTEIRSVAANSHDRDIVAEGYIRGFADALEIGDADRAKQLRKMMDALEPQNIYRDDLHRMDANLSIMAGNLDQAEQFALETISDEPGADLIRMHQLFQIRRLQGRTAEVIPLIENILQSNPALPVISAYLALGYASIGENEAAHAEWQRSAIDDISVLPQDLTWTSTIVALAETAYMIGNEKVAKQLIPIFRKYQPFHIMQRASYYFGAGAHYYGLLQSLSGKPDDARKNLKAGLVAHRAVGSEPMISRSLAALEKIA